MVSVCASITMQRPLREPRIEDAQVVGGHDGTPELLLKVRYPNGALSDVVMGNDLGVKLIARCGNDVAALAGQSWNEIMAVVDTVEAK